MLEVQRLYPQYRAIADRRKVSQPVAFERRSGIDRRAQDRVTLDTNLTRDIFEVKSKVAKVEKTTPKFFEKTDITRNVSNAVQNTANQDQFIKSTKIKSNENIKAHKADSYAPMAAGVLASIMGGVIGSALLGPAAGVVALGTGLYFGGKLLNQVIASHLKK